MKVDLLKTQINVNPPH